MELSAIPISSVGQNLPPVNGNGQYSGKPSKGEDHTLQSTVEDGTSDNCNQPLLSSSSNNMKAVKAVLQNGTGRIAPVSSADHSANGTGGGNNTEKAKLPSFNEDGADNLPQDRYNIVLIILIIHGVGILMPWNMFINANSYFTDYKLTYKHSNGTTEPSVYKEYFLSYLGFAAQVPNVLFNLFNIFFHFGGGNFTFRITGAIIIEIIIIVSTIALAIINTAEWTSGFFYLTMLSVVILNIANGVYQNSLYGLASKLPMKYSNAVVLGSNISGTLTSVVNIITIWASPNLRIAAIYYFVSALFVLLICFDTYLAFPINRFFRYYVLDERQKLSEDAEQKLTDDSSSDSAEIIEKANQRPPYMFVLRYAWKQCLNVFLVFFVTLSVFPVIQAGIEPLNKEFFGDSTTTKSYFSAVCCFLVFNGSAMLGNLIPNYMQLPGPDKLWIPVVLRFIFIPFFLFCNFAPENRIWPVYIQSDWLFVFAGMLLGLTSGYFSSLCMMYAPRSVPSEHAGTAGMMAAACLVMGIFFGINFSAVMAWLVKQRLL